LDYLIMPTAASAEKLKEYSHIPINTRLKAIRKCLLESARLTLVAGPYYLTNSEIVDIYRIRRTNQVTL
jgi:hypothetical protein